MHRERKTRVGFLELPSTVYDQASDARHPQLVRRNVTTWVKASRENCVLRNCVFETCIHMNQGHRVFAPQHFNEMPQQFRKAATTAEALSCVAMKDPEAIEMLHPSWQMMGCCASWATVPSVGNTLFPLK